MLSKDREIEEREKDFYYLFIFLGFSNNNKTDLHDGKEERTRKKEKKTKVLNNTMPRISLNQISLLLMSLASSCLSLPTSHLVLILSPSHFYFSPSPRFLFNGAGYFFVPTLIFSMSREANHCGP